MLYDATRLGIDRRLTMSMKGQENKIYVNQAFVDNQITKQCVEPADDFPPARGLQPPLPLLLK